VIPIGKVEKLDLGKFIPTEDMNEDDASLYGVCANSIKQKSAICQ
jgi:hypothetical protein